MPKGEFNKLLSDFIEITLQNGCSSKFSLIFRPPFPKKTSGGLLQNRLITMSISSDECMNNLCCTSGTILGSCESSVSVTISSQLPEPVSII